MTFKPAYSISPALLDTLKRVAVLMHDLNQRVPADVVQMELTTEAHAVSAFSSTTIEGNPLSLTAVKQLLKRAPQQLRQSEREVLNYTATLVNTAGQQFSEALVLNVHRGVTEGLLPDVKSGAWRREPVFVHDPRTAEVIYWPPDHQDVPRLMRELHEFVELNAGLDAIILAGLYHRQFALIHPFVDGNGRTVRLASTVLLRNLGVNLFPLLSFENYFNRNLSRYFQEVGGRGSYYDLEVDFTAWLEFAAEGILDEVQRLDKTLEQRQSGPIRLQAHHETLLAWLAEHGSISDREYALLVDRAKATRTLDFRFLLEHDLIERRGRGPATYYIRKLPKAS